jgi:hypothetical protein
MATMANPQRIPQTSYLANRAAQPPLKCPCVTLIKLGASRGGRSTPALRRLDSSNGMPTAVLPARHCSSLRRRLPPAVPGPAGSSQRGSLYTCWQAPSNILSPLLTGRRRKAADQTPRPQTDQHEVPYGSLLPAYGSSTAELTRSAMEDRADRQKILCLF